MGSLVGIASSAALYGLGTQIEGHWHLLAFFGLVPWLLALNATANALGAALSGLAMGIAFVAAIFSWFGFAIASYAEAPPWVGLLVLLGSAPLLQPQFITFALVRHYAGTYYGPYLRALAGASAWVATEWLMPKLLGDTLGYGLYPSRVLRQWADLGGTAGITFLLVIINESLALASARRRGGIRAILPPLAIALTLVALMGGYGIARLQAISPLAAEGSKPLRVGLVQSNIVSYERLRRTLGTYDAVRHILDTHYALSREAVYRYGVDALMWSETVYPTTFGHPKSEVGGDLDREIADFITGTGVPLLFGTYDRDEDGEYNAAFVIDPATPPLGIYRKTKLFLLTEYLPSWLDGPTFRSWIPWAGTWQAGSGARVLPLRLADGRRIPVLPLICLDDTDTGLAIQGARGGAQLIMVLSNDSWFTYHPAGARLHRVVSAFRSIETRLPQLRVTANGLSALIDPAGDIIADAGMGERRLVIGEVEPRPPPATLVVAWGDWVGGVGLALLIMLLLGVKLAVNRHLGHRPPPSNRA